MEDFGDQAKLKKPENFGSMSTYKFFGGPKDGAVMQVLEGQDQVVFQNQPQLRLVYDVDNPDVERFHDLDSHYYVKDRLNVENTAIEYFRYAEISPLELFTRIFLP